MPHLVTRVLPHYILRENIIGIGIKIFLMQILTLSFNRTQNTKKDVKITVLEGVKDM